jgi:thiol-disulfide isomerase/thioredoxin
MRARVRLSVAILLFLGAAPAAADVERDLQRFRGKVVVLNFWATWCAPCRDEIPLLVRIQREYGPKGVQVIGASIDEPGDRESAEAFVRGMRINYPVWYGRTTEDMKPFRLATSIPATAVFDRDGRPVFRIIGAVKEADLTPRLDWLLGARTGEAPAELMLPAGVTPEHFAEHEAGEEEGEGHDHGHEGEAHVESEGGSAVPT